MRVLQIIETAYRATIEEQDDTVVYITHALHGAGAAESVLLRGNAVNYAVADQDASGLRFGTWRQSEPPRIAADVASLLEKRVEVFAVREDLEERGVREEMLIRGIKTVSRSELAGLLERFDRIWHW